MRPVTEDDFAEPPSEGCLVQLKRWLYDDDRLSSGLNFTLFGLIGSAAALDRWVGVFLLGEEDLLMEFVLYTGLTFLSLLSGIGLLLRQGWVRSPAMGLSIIYPLYVICELIFVPGEGFSWYAAGILAFGFANVVQLPNMLITRQEEEEARELERVTEYLLDYTQSLLAQHEELAARVARAREEHEVLDPEEDSDVAEDPEAAD